MESATIIVFVTSALGLVSGCSNWPGVTSDSTPTGGAYQLEDTSGAIGSSCGSSTTCSQTPHVRFAGASGAVHQGLQFERRLQRRSLRGVPGMGVPGLPQTL